MAGVQDQPDTDMSVDHGMTVSLDRDFPDETSATKSSGYAMSATDNPGGADTRSIADMEDIGPDLRMDTVYEESMQGGGFSKVNMPVGAPVEPAKVNPGLRGMDD